MEVLVLGGTHHVGRSVVEAALARGHSVTALTRGVSGPPAAGARPLHADRLDRAAVEQALGADTWDAVIDTWSGSPRPVRDSAQILAKRAGHYCYVSSRSVYR
jgi:nucleoside-diphosphate-sugar epimerase